MVGAEVLAMTMPYGTFSQVVAVIEPAEAPPKITAAELLPLICTPLMTGAAEASTCTPTDPPETVLPSSVGVADPVAATPTLLSVKELPPTDPLAVSRNRIPA
jgi:hypothetical protein